MRLGRSTQGVLMVLEIDEEYLDDGSSGDDPWEKLLM